MSSPSNPKSSDQATYELESLRFSLSHRDAPRDEDVTVSSLDVDADNVVPGASGNGTGVDTWGACVVVGARCVGLVKLGGL